jgi:hypothetical protein
MRRGHFIERSATKALRDCVLCEWMIAMHNLKPVLPTIYDSHIRSRCRRAAWRTMLSFKQIFYLTAIIIIFACLRLYVYITLSRMHPLLVSILFGSAVGFVFTWRFFTVYNHAYTATAIRLLGLCRHCGYNLCKLTTNRCPECGQPTQGDDVTETQQAPGGTGGS